jgi:hypothetical protein
MNTLYSNSSLFAIVAASPADATSGAAAANPEAAKPEETSIPKPPKGEDKMSRFKSKNLGREKVATQIAGLPHYSVPEAKDWVRLHPDEENFWSDELCFVSIPVPGQKRDMVHLIDSDLAGDLPSAERKDHEIPLGVSEQTEKHLLPRACPQHKSGQQMERDEHSGM